MKASRAAVLTIPTLALVAGMGCSPVIQPYTDDANLHCTFETNHGEQTLSWNPIEQKLIFDGQELPVHRVRDNRRSVSIRTSINNQRTTFDYLGNVAEGTLHIQWDGGGAFVSGPCNVIPQ